MKQRMQGSLRTALRYAKTAWYASKDGLTTAYYEHPRVNVPGGVFLNGQKIIDLIVDREGRYLDYPSPNVERRMRESGIDLENGWTCAQAMEGESLNEAIEQSGNVRAAIHPTGMVVVELFTANGRNQANLYVQGVEHIVIAAIETGHFIIQEFGIDTQSGWYPAEKKTRIDGSTYFQQKVSQVFVLKQSA